MPNLDKKSMKMQFIGHESFADLIDLLRMLDVIDIRYHSVSHTASLKGFTGFPIVKPHWIPLMVISTAQHYAEIVPRGQGNRAPF